MINVYCLTSSKYIWAIEPFAYLFNTFWSAQQPCYIVTDAEPDFSLPTNFGVHLINKGEPLEQEKWSNGVIEFLNRIEDELLVILLEDYWIVRKVDNQGVNTLGDLMRAHPDIIRVDLTDDRQYAGDMEDVGYFGHYDLVETPNDSPYQLSLQAGIWRRELLLKLLRPDLSPWQVELYLSPTMYERDDMRVLGTRQRPIRYINAFKGGDSEKVLNLEGIPKEHLRVMEERGWLKD